MCSKLFFFSLSFLITSALYPQEIKKGEVYAYARKIVDTMASENMHGRGYVNGGDSIAAFYLKGEFQRFGLKPFGDDYYQRFSFAVNTFPDVISMKADNKTLIPGADYIIFAHSSSINGTYKVAFADDRLSGQPRKFKKFLKNGLVEKALVINDTGKQTKGLHDLLANEHKSKVIIALKDKLMLSTSQEVYPGYALIEMLRSSYTYPKEITVDIQNKFIPDHPAQNVIGFISGSEYPDSFIVYSAHYDHLGQMGKDVYFPGANDNASGCAMLLNLASYYSMPEHKPKCSVAFMAFCGEEVGLLGSKYYTENPLFPLKNIKFLLNMDLMGTGDDGITVVNGSLFKKEFDKLKEINTANDLIKDVRIRGKAPNSDHYFFSEKGVRAFFTYTLGGIKAYHDIYDKPETLPLTEFEDLFKLIVKFGDYLQN